MENSNLQFAEPQVSEQKFGEELAAFKGLGAAWRSKGVFLIREQFPEADFLFAAPQLRPSSVVFAVRLDFSSYDAHPISVKFIHPYTAASVTRKEVPIAFRLPGTVQQLPGLPLNVNVPGQDLLQGAADDEPFFCMRGVREYHLNPAHTGDSWYRYRGTGVGTLDDLINQLYNHSLPSIVAHRIETAYHIHFYQP